VLAGTTGGRTSPGRRHWHGCRSRSTTPTAPAGSCARRPLADVSSPSSVARASTRNRSGHSAIIASRDTCSFAARRSPTRSPRWSCVGLGEKNSGGPYQSSAIQDFSFLITSWPAKTILILYVCLESSWHVSHHLHHAWHSYCSISSM
jgi:hypothetical protein